jgi:hypothetical protein
LESPQSSAEKRERYLSTQGRTLQQPLDFDTYQSTALSFGEAYTSRGEFDKSQFIFRAEPQKEARRAYPVRINFGRSRLERL